MKMRIEIDCWIGLESDKTLRRQIKWSVGEVSVQLGKLKENNNDGGIEVKVKHIHTNV